ncbi:MAG TPA: sulfatase-like hydrolase/transferase [Candidatus Limnocylindrales bacterium]|nr:sulfatase-like hydrolase/transferase [Candidatus Limnocylindrales bacterium]
MERIPAYTAFYYWFGIVMLWQARRLKYAESGEKRSIRFWDFFWFFVVSVAVGTGLSFEHIWLNRVLFMLTGTLFLGLWLDAIVMNQFAIQINPHVLRIYLSNAAHMSKEACWAWRKVARKPLLAFFPLASLTFYFLFIFRYHSGLCWAFPLPAIYCLGGLRSAKGQVSSLAASAAAGLGMLAVALFLGSVEKPVMLVQGPLPNWIAVGTTGVLLALLARRNITGRTTCVAARQFNFIPEARVRSGRYLPGASVRLPDLVPIPLQRQQRSDWFHQYGDSNVILVTLESISRSQVSFLSGQGARMPVFETLARRGLSSQRHFCVSPNTNNAVSALYNGNYRNELTFPHLRTLHENGYKSVFIVPQDSAGFGLDQLLRQMGFQHVIDLNTFPEYPRVKEADRRGSFCLLEDELLFYQKALEKLTQIVKPTDKVFLHVMNSQTHFPYLARDQTAPEGSRERYVAAVEEADTCLGQFLLQLDQLVPLHRTLLAYTADHGESLGERGYRAHSTAVTKEQVDVPFTIHHPGMPHVEVPFSTHFDVLPTIFDLLGVRYDYPAIGSTMMAGDRELNTVLFSETRHGRTPSCYGHVGLSTKIFFDVALDRYFLMDLDDNIIKNLSSGEREQYEAVLFSALQTRGLVGS